MNLRRTPRHGAMRRTPQNVTAYRAMAVRLALVAVGVAVAVVAINTVAGRSAPESTVGGWATAYPVGSVSGPGGWDGGPVSELPSPTGSRPAEASLVPVTGGGPVDGTRPAGPGATTPGGPRRTGPSPTGVPTGRTGTPSTGKPSPPPRTPAAYPTIQAESYDREHGIRTESSGGITHIGYIATGDWVRYDNVDFTGDAARGLLIRASNAARQNRTGRVELRLGRRSNPPVGSMTIPNNGDWFTFSTYRMRIPPTTGVHTVYLTFTSRQDEEFANVDWLRFEH